MSSRPLTPPYVPFGIRRFNRLSAIDASARTGQGSHSTLPVRAFCLLQSDSILHFRLSASSPVLCSPIGKPATPVLLTFAGFAPSFEASSTVSKCTCASVFVAIHSSFVGFVSCLLHRSIQSSHECRLTHFP